MLGSLEQDLFNPNPLFLSHVALQEPVGDRDAGQPGAGTALLVERVHFRQASGRIPPSKTLEPATRSGLLDTRELEEEHVFLWP